jgi:hypothetical protein
MLCANALTTFTLFLFLTASATALMISSSVVGYTTDGTWHSMRSFHLPYAFDKMQLVPSHCIGDRGGSDCVICRRLEIKRRTGGNRRMFLVVPIFIPLICIIIWHLLREASVYSTALVCWKEILEGNQRITWWTE